MSGDKLSDVVGDLILLVGTGYGCAWGDGSGGGLSIEPSLRKAIPDVVAGEGNLGPSVLGGEFSRSI